MSELTAISTYYSNRVHSVPVNHNSTFKNPMPPPLKIATITKSDLKNALASLRQ